VKILHVAAEVAPWSATGGLAHVASALPAAQVAAGGRGTRVAIVAPAYRDSRRRVARAGRTLVDVGIDVSVVLAGHRHGGRLLAIDPPDAAPLFLLDCPAFYDRDGIYGDAGGEFGDNALRFAMLARGAVDASERLLGGVPDVLHAHDWPAGLVPAYARASVGDWLADTRCVFTIHNLAYQGVFPKHRLPEVGLPWSTFTFDRLEFHDQVSFLKAGIAISDAVTTVSPTYAREIVTPAQGHFLDGFLRDSARRLTGILNGIDVDGWNPATDPHIPATFTAASLQRRAANRTALLAEMGLSAGDGELVLGVVTRLAEQKGMDLVAEIVPRLTTMGARLVMLGSGDRWLEERFSLLSSWFSRELAVRIGYDEALARRIYAGADAILVPSRFEPCGLAQMYAMRYGAVPIVHAVGGLRDTVIDPGDDALARGEGGGIRFEHATVDGLAWALDRACNLFRGNPAGWRRASAANMSRDVSWHASATAYLALYRDIA
jgi:starch synthase